MDIATQLFDRLKAIGPEVGAEVSRLGTQGSMEMASALFHGSAWVPYGPGQNSPSIQNDQPEVEQQRTMGMER